MKIGLVFPGQGSQYPGMGKEFYSSYSVARELFDSAEEVLDFDLKKLIFEGQEKDLSQTKLTQPAVFVTNAVMFKVFTSCYSLVSLGLTSQTMVAGHSLGEYSALYSAEAFDFSNGLKLVKARAEFIHEVSEKNPGTMAAIIGLDKEKVSEICSKASEHGIIEMVNFNSPEQIVISGELSALEEAVKLCKESGARKAVILNVSGAFHSSLMKQSAELMSGELDKYCLSDPKMPVVTNCDAEITGTGKEIKDKLIRQINHPVLWDLSVGKMINSGVDTFIELGPGRVLSGLIRRTNREIKTLNVEDKKSLEKTLGELCVKKN